MSILSKIASPFVYLWKALSTRLWLIISSVFVILALVVSITLTQNLFLYNTMAGVFGGETVKLVSGDPDAYQRYTTDYTNKEEVYNAANDFNESIAEDGFILLKNDNNALPIATQKSKLITASSTAPKISVFGKNSVDLVYGGSGSSQADSSKSISIQDALTDAGYDVNPSLTSFYDSSSQSGSGRPSAPAMGTILTGFPTGETPITSLTNQTSVTSTYGDYSDAALIVVSRLGGEGYDLPTTMFWNGSNYGSWGNTSPQAIPGREIDDHYLELDQNEQALIDHVTSSGKFDKVIIVVNVSQSMELGFIEENDKIDAAVWIGGPGGTGINALGSILNGNVNPSGRTVDTFVTDLKNDPTWNNFGNNRTQFGNYYILDRNGSQSEYGKYTVEYQEGIYIGYNYYETRGFEENDGDSWYNANVVYPLGYGLSYTEFNQNIDSTTYLDKDGEVASELVEGGSVEVEVTVTNTGSFAGKEVVQIYFTSPYKTGEIEKSYKTLGGFAKTDIIKVGESETVTVSIPAYYFASYDYNDANKNDHYGYEIENGEYIIWAGENAHDSFDSSNLSQGASIKISTDEKTGYTVENRFDFVDINYAREDFEYMTRSDFEGTFPSEVLSREDRTVDEDFIKGMGYTIDDKETDPWYTKEMPTQGAIGDDVIMLYEMVGTKPSTDPEKWDAFMDQITVEDMAKLIGTGNYQTTAITQIGKFRTTSVDGPVGIVAFMGDSAVYGTASYVSGCILAATYNVEMAEGFGGILGDESIIGNEKGDGATYPSWYAPGVNIHRNAFGGRNWEYYSEDATLSGIMGGYVIKGARAKGLVTHIKHFALNDQETNRCQGVSTWCNEQAMREIYLRAFEIAIKDGESLGVMTSFNSIGQVWAGGSYELLTEVLRNEWGFEGSVITDYNFGTPYMNVNQMIRAGGDLNLAQDNQPSTSVNTATQVAAIREAAQNILYSISASSAMNGHGEGNVWKMVQPDWVTFMICVDIAIAIVIAGLGVLFILLRKKKEAGTASVESNDNGNAEPVADSSQE